MPDQHGANWLLKQEFFSHFRAEGVEGGESVETADTRQPKLTNEKWPRKVYSPMVRRTGVA